MHFLLIMAALGTGVGILGLLTQKAALKAVGLIVLLLSGMLYFALSL